MLSSDKARAFDLLLEEWTRNRL